MELIYIVTIAFFLGLGVRYAVPGRQMHGFLLLPAIATVAASLVWVGLIWLGWTADGGWIWVLSLLAAVLAPLPFALLLPGRRTASDERLLTELAGRPV